MTFCSKRALARIALLSLALFAARLPATETKVSIVENGAEPREVLAFKPVKDSKQFSRLVIKSSKNMKAPTGESQSMDLPILTLELGCDVLEVGEDGSSKIKEKLIDTKVEAGPGTDAQMATMFSQTYSQLEGLTSEASVKFNGERKQLAGADNPVGGGAVGDMTASFSVSFPEEPVGVGAKWDVEAAMDQQGLTLNMKYSYELVRREGSKIEVKVVVEGSAPAQELKLPNMPPGAKAELLSASMSGLGTAEFDLGRLNPTKSSQVLTNDTKVRMTNGEQTMEMDQRIQMDQAIQDIAEPASKSEAEAPSASSAKPKTAPKPRAGKKPKPSPK